MEDYNPKEFLLFALQHFDIEVVSHNEKMVYIAQGYTVEIERKDLFKLLHNNLVIAPFADIEELCSFIKKDMELHEES